MLDKEVSEMTDLANFLMKYQKSKQDIIELSILKKRDVEISGYEISLNFSKERDNDVIITTLQIYSKYQPFLPFNIVCNLAKLFLGEKELGLVELIILGRKIYAWSVVTKDDVAVPMPQSNNLEIKTFDNLSFCSLPAFVI